MSRSTAMPAGSRNRTRLAALAAVTAGLALTAVGLPATAFGAGGPSIVTYDSGSLDWGVKASFRSYVTGSVGAGAVELSGGATTNADGSFRFGLASARYDLGTHTLDSSFTGGVRFTAHHGGLDIALSDLRITTSGTTGTLTADTAAKESIGATETTRRDDVPLVTFTVGRDTTTGAATAARLTEQGAKAFAGFYQAGAEMDPLALLLKQSPATPSATASPSASATATATATSTATATATSTASATATTSPTATTSATASPTAGPSATATASPTATGSPTATQGPTAGGRLPIVNGTLEWSVKESFRRYVEGPLAHGKVEFGGGAADYRFGGASGAYDTATHAVTAGFTGSVRFLGHPGADGGYQLDTTLARLGVSIDRSGAFLTADVSAKSRDGGVTTLTGVRIAELDLTGLRPAPVNGVVTLSAVPAKLTADGVAAFAQYRAGEALDPVTVRLAFDKDARLPTGPAGSGTVTGGAAGGSGAGTAGGATLTTSGGGLLASTGADAPVVPLLATAAGLLLLGGGATALVRRRGEVRV
ncbi:HtaA domain-containing protein [Kitasatospora sp. NPDC004240]